MRALSLSQCGTTIAYSPDGKHIISESDDMTILIWDVVTGAAVGTHLEGYTSTVWSVAHSPNEWCIVSGSSDKTT
jgi:WD40 repeat protein